MEAHAAVRRSGAGWDIRYDVAIYAVPTGGTALWSETNPSVQVRGGLFSVLLGSINNLPGNVIDNENRWFGVSVGTDPEMDPRQKIASVAFAKKAAVADLATTVPDGAIMTGKLADGAVTAAKIADGAVTDAKITRLLGTQVTWAVDSASHATSAGTGNCQNIRFTLLTPTPSHAILAVSCGKLAQERR